jgi:hypothetical protein
MEVVKNSVDFTTYNNLTLFQHTWLIGYSAKEKQGNFTTRGALCVGVKSVYWRKICKEERQKV